MAEQGSSKRSKKKDEAVVEDDELDDLLDSRQIHL